MNDLLDAVALIDSRYVLIVLLLALDIWAIGMTLASEASRKEKFLWSAIVIMCPIIGCLFWFSLGPKPDVLGSVASSSGQDEAS